MARYAKLRQNHYNPSSNEIINRTEHLNRHYEEQFIRFPSEISKKNNFVSTSTPTASQNATK